MQETTGRAFPFLCFYFAKECDEGRNPGSFTSTQYIFDVFEYHVIAFNLISRNILAQQTCFPNIFGIWNSWFSCSLKCFHQKWLIYLKYANFQFLLVGDRKNVKNNLKVWQNVSTAWATFLFQKRSNVIFEVRQIFSRAGHLFGSEVRVIPKWGKMLYQGET